MNFDSMNFDTLNRFAQRRYVAAAEFVNDPRFTMPLAVAAGAIKGALLGIVIGKVATTTAIGICTGAAIGGLLSLRNTRAGDGHESGYDEGIPLLVYAR